MKKSENRKRTIENFNSVKLHASGNKVQVLGIFILIAFMVLFFLGISLYV